MPLNPVILPVPSGGMKTTDFLLISSCGGPDNRPGPLASRALVQHQRTGDDARAALLRLGDLSRRFPCRTNRQSVAAGGTV